MRQESLQMEAPNVATVPCPGCSHPLRLGQGLRGRRIRCLSCRSVLAVEASEELGSLTCAVVVDGGARVQLCPECGNRLRVVRRLHGRRVRCKSCQTVLRVSAKPWKLVAILPQQTTPPPPSPDNERAIPADARPTGEDLPDKPIPAESDAARSADGGAEGEAPRGANGNATQPVAQPEKKPARPLRSRPLPDSAFEKADKWRPAGKRLTWTGVAFTVASLAVAVVGLTAVGGGALGIWWLLFSGSVHPQARYLPEDCDWFLSLDWQRCTTAGESLGLVHGSQGITLLQRCRVFLTNAELPSEAVERVSAGRAADGSGMVVVYRLARDIKPDDVLQKRAFQGRDKSRYTPEKIGGVPVFVYQTAALAFPEPKVVLSGDFVVLRRMLTRWSSGIRDPMKSLLEGLDFSKPNVSAATGAPKPLLTAYLQDCQQLELAIVGTRDSCEFGKPLRFVRILRIAESQAAGQIQHSLKRSLAETASNPKTPEAIRKALASVEIADSEDGVQIAVALGKDELKGPLPSTLKALLQ